MSLNENVYKQSADMILNYKSENAFYMSKEKKIKKQKKNALRILTFWLKCSILLLIIVGQISFYLSAARYSEGIDEFL